MEGRQMPKRPISDTLPVGWRTPAYAWMWENFDAMNKAGQVVAYSTYALRMTCARVKADKARTGKLIVRPKARASPVAIPIPADEPSEGHAGFKFRLIKLSRPRG